MKIFWITIFDKKGWLEKSFETFIKKPENISYNYGGTFEKFLKSFWKVFEKFLKSFWKVWKIFKTVRDKLHERHEIIHHYPIQGIWFQI